jgi:hypothetical protein
MNEKKKEKEKKKKNEGAIFVAFLSHPLLHLIHIH